MSAPTATRLAPHPPLRDPVQLPSGYNRYTVHGAPFDVPARYRAGRLIGKGAYGIVCSATDTVTGQRVALKKCVNVFREVEDGKRVLREIRLLSFMKHENILTLTCLIPPQDDDTFADVYMVTPLMDCDLARVIASRQPLDDNHLQFFTYQILRGLKYLHSARIIHRDLKPANILTNLACDVRIADFGLARGVAGQGEAMTDYVVTRHYRAPELLLQCQQYTPNVDVWSVGCILAELANRKVLFPGKGPAEQLELILHALGSPAESELEGWLSGPPLRWLRRQKARNAVPLGQLVPRLGAEVETDFLGRALTFSPLCRPGAAELLAHPYLASLHDPNDEPVARTSFKWEHSDLPGTMDAEGLRRGFLEEFRRADLEGNVTRGRRGTSRFTSADDSLPEQAMTGERRRMHRRESGNSVGSSAGSAANAVRAAKGGAMPVGASGIDGRMDMEGTAAAATAAAP